MSMVYGFVRQSSGTVDIVSEPNKGTSVTIWLPAEIPPSHAAQIHSQSVRKANSPPEQGLALLVEDDADVRRVVRRLLLDLGFSVLEAETGVEALQILTQTSGIRLLLTDIVMPGGVDGRQVARHALEQGQVPKIILMSGYAPDSDELPDIPLLAKPFTKAQLADLLQEAVL
jgi:CheY-like chemotaxis protein